MTYQVLRTGQKKKKKSVRVPFSKTLLLELIFLKHQFFILSLQASSEGGLKNEIDLQVLAPCQVQCRKPSIF